MVKSPPVSAGDARNVGLIPGSGRSSGVGSCNLLQYSYLENPKDRGAWWATVHGVVKSQTRLSDFTLTFFYFKEYRFKPVNTRGMEVSFYVNLHIIPLKFFIRV